MASPHDDSTHAQDAIRVNRAPVLTLWAAVVAERLGHDADAAITLGRQVAGSSARVKARAIGLEDKHAEPAASTEAPRQVQRYVRLLGHDVAVVEHDGSDVAAEHGKPASPRPAYAYVGKAFGIHLRPVRAAMERLADSLPPDKLNRTGFRLYEQFRPTVPPGAKGWGAKGILDLDRIDGLRAGESPSKAS